MQMLDSRGAGDTPQPAPQQAPQQSKPEIADWDEGDELPF
jgi:hypothetical protein